jgi:DNA polymerase-3 subunit beta
MILRIEKKALLRALTRVSGAVGTNTNIPITDHVKIEIVGDTAHFTATDLHITVSAFETGITGEGAAALPYKMLLDTVKLLPDESLTMRATAQKAEIEASTGKYKFVASPAEDFPRFEFEAQGDALVNSALLAEAITACLPFVSNDELRPQMCGLCFKAKDGYTEVAATDAHRLAVVKLPVANINFTLPKKAAGIVRGLLNDEVTQFMYNDRQAQFAGQGWSMVTTLTEGRFPDYSAVIPKECDKVLLIDKKALTDALKRISVYSNKTTHGVVLTAGEDGVTVTAADTDMGNEAKEDFPALLWWYGGAPIRIGFNGRYALEVLAALKGEKARFQMSTPARAVTFPDEENLFLLMPIMIE